MKSLDLHGRHHYSIQDIVEEFIYCNETPLKIVTGNSQRMRELVTQVVERNGLYYHFENLINTGCLIITRNKL